MSLNPWLRSPLTDLTGNLFNYQARPHTFCAKLELRVLDCLEAYGIDLAPTKCSDLLADYRECATEYKQTERSRLMQIERYRQSQSGQRKERFEPGPPCDAM